MSTLLRVLIVEDSEDDTLLLARELRKGGFDPQYLRVDTAADMTAALDEQTWDIVIADYSMPKFSALEALSLVRHYDVDMPFIIVSGTIGEDVAVAAMKAGAQDYLMKGSLARLVPAINRECREAQVRREGKLAEEALRQAQKMESLGVLAGGVAHDFNNLLAAMLGQSSLALAKLPVGSPAAEHIEKSINAAERAADLTRQMLAYAGRGCMAVRSVDLNDLVRENLSLLEVAVPKHVALHAELGDGLPLVRADPGQLQQVVMNLILNAAQAVEDSSGVVKVATAAHRCGPEGNFGWRYYGEEIPGPCISIAVSDNGQGMDAATLSKIFDPFFTTKKSGRGLGLAAVLGVVRGHRGSLRVKSAPGLGTIFELFFPVGEGFGPEPEEARRRDRPDVRTHGGCVLVIDDESPVRDAVSDILELGGVQALTAPDGKSGLALYRERMADIDLVLLDLSMPGLSGEETLRELYKINPEARVIVSSGYSRGEAADRLGPDGQGLDFMQKPYNIDTLLEAVLGADH